MGYRSFMVMYPKLGKGAVFMSNSDNGFALGMEVLRSVSAVYDWPDYKTQEFRRATSDKKQQAKFIGQYEFSVGWQAEIIQVQEASGIAVQFPNGDVYPLEAIEGADQYIHAETGVEVSFAMPQGQVELNLYNQTGIQKL